MGFFRDLRTFERGTFNEYAFGFQQRKCWESCCCIFFFKKNSIPVSYGVVEDETIACNNHLSINAGHNCCSLHVSSKHIVITISNVKRGSFILGYHKNPYHKKANTLSDMGAPPFKIILDIRLLRPFSENNTLVLPFTPKFVLLDNAITESVGITPSNLGRLPRRVKGKGRCIDNSMQDLQIEDFIEANANKAFENEIIEDDDDDEDNDEDDNEYNESENDDQDKDISNSSGNITRPTRVLKDIFHAMDMLKLPMKHGAFKDFMKSYRDALFVFDEDDKKRVEKVLYLKFNKITFKAMLAQNPDWILQRVKRAVPPPNILLPIITELFDTYGNIVCSRSKDKLFDNQAWKKAASIKASIKQGHLSDPIGISLYYKIKEDKFKLPIYRCVRGTNSVEGGIHTGIIRKFGFFNASPDLAECALANYRLRHNANVRLNTQSNTPCTNSMTFIGWK